MTSDTIEIFIHFGVDEHFIPVSDFTISSKSITAIAEAINQHIFNGELKYQLVILPPESGSLLKKVGIIYIGGALLAGLLGEYSSGFFKGLALGAVRVARLSGEDILRILDVLPLGCLRTGQKRAGKLDAPPPFNFLNLSSRSFSCHAIYPKTGIHFSDCVLVSQHGQQ
ncbi:MAG: hypothetical protein L3J67_02620 [Hyphomicrobiaceae bacterium]|nr:hypothetical protein [Hyphomicrobiaceae bacterium]